jgi:hypothetical protein
MANIHCQSCDAERRDFLKKVGKTGIGLGVMGLSLGSTNFMRQAMGVTPTNAFYDCAMQVFFSGGPTAIDVWDPKPGSRNNFVGTINLGAKDPYGEDVLISEIFPQLAQLAINDPAVGVGVFRSMVHRNNSHGTAQQYMNNFWEGAPATLHPSTAAVMAYYYQGTGLGIPSVVINGNNGQNANVANQSRVPTALQVTAGSGQGNNPTVEALQLPPGVNAARYQRRQNLITALNQRFLAAHPDDIAAAYKKATEDAASVTMKGDAAKAFDLTGVTLVPARNNGDAMRLTQAVRLLDAGVPYVACGIGGNDSHGNNVQTIQGNWGQSVDGGVVEVVNRLKASGKRALIVMGGEFGRTPNSVNNSTTNNQTIANANLGRNGRDHWGDSFSWAVISVNQPKFKTGAYGYTGPDGNWRESNNDPATQTKDPVHPRDLGGFVYRALGFQTGLDVAYDVPLTDRAAPAVDRVNISTKLLTNFGLV